ncbi:MAG: isochorismate synthase [Myxococcota bacterium]
MSRDSGAARSPAYDSDGFRDAWATALAEAEASGHAQVVAARVELEALDPLAAFGAFTDADRFFWAQPGRGRWLVAQGVAACVESAGSEPIREADGAIRLEMARVHCADRETRAALRWVGGFSFDANHRAQGDWARFPSGRLILPRCLLLRNSDGVLAVLAHRIEAGTSAESALAAWQTAVAEMLLLGWAPDAGGPSSGESDSNEVAAEYTVAADRSHSRYRRQVADAVDAIGSGAFEKVVLARSLEVRHRGRYAVSKFLERLCAQYPACTVLAVARGGHVLVSASPEFLVSLEGDTLHTQAVAGSAPRGSSPEQDALFASTLRESKKEQAEHAAVVRAVRSALRPSCGELEGPESPGLLQLEGIQHLSTPLTGRLRDDSDVRGVLELVDLLHPTPAVCGLPREAARAWIEAHEHLERGWYAGPVGWLTASGAGEFWLALRAGLILQPDDGSPGEPALARLFAGAGIVEASQPESELVETRLKLRALLAPLTEI